MTGNKDNHRACDSNGSDILHVNPESHPKDTYFPALQAMIQGHPTWWVAFHTPEPLKSPTVKKWCKDFVEHGGLCLIRDDRRDQRPKGALGRVGIAMASGLLPYTDKDGDLQLIGDPDFLEQKYHHVTMEFGKAVVSGMMMSEAQQHMMSTRLQHNPELPVPMTTPEPVKGPKGWN